MPVSPDSGLKYYFYVCHPCMTIIELRSGPPAESFPGWDCSRLGSALPSAFFLAGRRPGCGPHGEGEAGCPRPTPAFGHPGPQGAAEGGNISLTPPPRPGWFRSLEPAPRPVRRWLAERRVASQSGVQSVWLSSQWGRVRDQTPGPETRGPRLSALAETRATLASQTTTTASHPGEWAALAPPRPHHAPTTPASLKFLSRGFAATVSPARSAFGSSAS